MSRFIRLELNRYRQVALQLVLVATVSMLGPMFLFATIGRFDSGEAALRDYDVILALALTIALSAQVVLGAAVYARLVVTDYLGTNRTQLYTYPGGRSPWFVAKNLAFTLVLAGSSMLGLLVAIGLFFVIESVARVVPEGGAAPPIFSLVVGPLGVVGLSLSAVLIAGVIAIRRQSAVATVVAAVIILCLIGNVVAFAPTIGLPGLPTVGAFLGVAAALVALRGQADRVRTDEVL